MTLMRICILLLVSISFCQAQRDCTLKLDKDSIKVFACAAVNSKFKSIRSEFIVNSNLHQMAAVLLDIDFYEDWQYKTVSAKVLKKLSEQELIYYTEVAAPILTSNRDFVIRLTVAPDPMTKGLIATAVSEPHHIPAIDNIVRVPYSKATWVITPLGPNKLAVTYTIDIDLGGSVPPWLVNLLSHQAPYETFKALREKIGDYRGKRVHFLGD